MTSVFSPRVGGTERIAEFLATAFTQLGHEVTVLTSTPLGGNTEPSREYAVIRVPSRGRLLRELAGCDVLLQLGTSLRMVWAALATATPIVISHQTWFERHAGRLRSVERIKRAIALRSRNIVPSNALLPEVDGRAVVIPNCYDEETFRREAGVPRPHQIAFVGRLVSDKGVDLLIEAVARLRDEGVHARLTVIGDGPDRPGLVRLAQGHGLADDVDFLGSQNPASVARLLADHRILAVPSRWAEPFGIVALEGIACGCRLVVAGSGGLPEVAGPFGTTFSPGDASALAAAVYYELVHAERLVAAEPDRTKYLARFSPATVAARYLEVLQAAARRPTRRGGDPTVTAAT